MNRLKSILFFSYFYIQILAQFDSYKSDLIIFSYNRPLQLYSFLESTNKYIKNLDNIYLIYRTSNEDYEVGYQEVKREFSNVIFLKQEINTQINNFRELTLNCLKKGSNKHIMFAVDDIIVKDYTDISQAIYYLEKVGAYGFYLKMGAHLTECLNAKIEVDPKSHLQAVPKIYPIEGDVFSWNFDEGEKDWNYPNSVDMVLYRKSDILPVLESFDFTGPNMLEDYWARKFPKNKLGLFYNLSKIVNIPINVVQDYWYNNNLKLYTPEQLLEIFNKKLKIDINSIYKVLNNDVHWAYNPVFIPR